MKIHMQIIKKMSLLLFMVFVISCNNSNDGVNIVKNVPLKEDLINDIITEGNVDSYNALLFHYYNDISIIPMAIHMSERYDYGKACSDLFYTMYSAFDGSTSSVDSMTRNYLLYYLRKGIELKDTTSAWIMSRLYVSGLLIEKDTNMAKQCLMSVFSSKDVDTLYWPYLKKHPNL